VLLVGDIERGGVFAAFVGTLALLDAADRDRVAGLVVNKFRGDPVLLAPGLADLSARTGVPVLGVIPVLDDASPPSEDSLSLDRLARRPAGPVVARVVVARLPRIANFDELEPLAEEPGVELRLATRASDLAGADLVVLPGSKSTVADLGWLRATGLAAAVVAHAAAGGAVLGICGGYQMLGRAISDPGGVESDAGCVEGLGLLAVDTVFAPGKTTVRVRARSAGPFFGALEPVRGYEIHSGRTTPVGRGVIPLLTIVERAGAPVDQAEGALGAGGAVAGTSVHGLLADGGARRALLCWLARRAGRAALASWGAPAPAAARHDRLADAVAGALDTKAIARLVGLAL
jgi:adenosylcobyric acid synthase